VDQAQGRRRVCPAAVVVVVARITSDFSLPLICRKPALCRLLPEEPAASVLALQLSAILALVHKRAGLAFKGRVSFHPTLWHSAAAEVEAATRAATTAAAAAAAGLLLRALSEAHQRQALVERHSQARMS